MREILFRGKCIDNGEWVEGSLLIDTIDDENGIHKNYIITDTTYGTYYMQGVEETVLQWTVGQYTGLTDKNGVKIFEGDIISAGNELVTVAWRGTQILALKSNNRPMTWEIAGRGEIIGNIHDNPELLENRKI